MSLQHYLQMNSSWIDTSGNGYNGVPSGAVINATDQKLGSGCGDFDGLNDEVTFATYHDPSGDASLSVDGWLANTSATIVNDGLLSWNSGGNYLQFQTDNTDAEFMRIYFTGGNARFPVGALGSGLHYFGIAYDGTQATDADRLKFYFDGAWKTGVFTGTVPATLPASLGSFVLGSDPTFARYWEGLLDDIGVYDDSKTKDYFDFRYAGGAGRELLNGNMFFFNEE